VAQERLQIRLDAIDNTRRAFKSIEGSLSRMRQRIFSLQSLFATLGAGFVLKSFISVGSEVENLRLRFNFLFGDVKEGQKAFQGLINFASKVPFTLQEIAQASGNLAVISKDANELTKNLRIAGNVASVTGLDFRTVGEQLQRSFAGGISSADIFRERGVRALLGFKAGATVTVEETIKAFEEAFGEGGKFGRASEILGTTFTGTLSMLSDKLFKFKLDVSEAGIFDFAKAGLAVINDLIEKNSKLLQGFAQSIGTGLVDAITGLILGAGEIFETIKGVFSIIGAGFAGVLDLIKALPAGVRELGVLGFLLLGGRGKIIVLGIGAILKKLGVDLEEIKKQLGFGNDNMEEFNKQSSKAENFIKLIKEQVIKNVEEITKMNEAIAEASKNAGKVKDSFVGVEISLAKINEALLTKANDSFKKINETIATGILTGIKSISQGLAESIVLGKKLSDTLRNIAQNILVSIIAKLIEEQLLKLATLAIDKLREAWERRKEQAIKAQNAQLKQQIALQAILLALGGGGGGGGFGFAEGGRVNGTRANGGATQNGNAYIVGERGRELFIPSTDGQIVSNENLKTMGGANITFNINATDVKGVKELLIDNRATITNIINSALNQKGKPALV
jgi:hypothetical protein